MTVTLNRLREDRVVAAGRIIVSSRILASRLEQLDGVGFAEELFQLRELLTRYDAIGDDVKKKVRMFSGVAGA